MGLNEPNGFHSIYMQDVDDTVNRVWYGSAGLSLVIWTAVTGSGNLLQGHEKV